MLASEITSSRVGDDASVVSVRGEIDLYTAPKLEAELSRALRDEDGAVIVDLADASFIDSTVLAVLLAARKRLNGRGRELKLVSDDPRILRVFQITGLDRRFRIEPTLTEALGTFVTANGR